MLFSPVGRSETVDRRAFTRTMRILESRYPVDDWSRGMTPFEILISTILSQSTTVANERRGLNDLRSSVGAITPQRLADTPEGEIAKAIWHAGLATQKAPRTRGAAGSSPTAVRCAKPGILGAASAPFGPTAIGTNASGAAKNGRAAEFGVRRQRIKSAARLARERILDGVGLRLCAADETPDRCPPAARRGRRLHRDERGRGGRLAIRPPDARGPPGGRGRERDEPLLGPRPRLGHAPDPDPTVRSEEH